jgi:predicted metal-binding protein
MEKVGANQIIYKTSGGHEVPIHFGCGYLPTADVKVDLEFTREKCSKCSSKAYSCPPFSPDWNKIPHKKYLAVFWWYIHLVDWYTSSDPKYGFYATNQVSQILASTAKRFGFFAEQFFDNTHFWSTGSCRICKPCRNKLGLPCAHPDKLRFALESTGVLVESLTLPFNHKLYWKKRKSESKEYLPEYTTAVIALESDENEYLKVDINKLLYNFV